MNSKMFKIIALTVILVCLSGFSLQTQAVGKSDYSESNGKVDISTDQATISVTGGSNVPFYHVQLKADNSSYMVKFQNMEEFVDKNNDGQYQNSEIVPLSTKEFPGLGWSFSNFSTIKDGIDNIQMVEFNFTHSTAPMITLNNHVNVSNGNEIKFDIGLDQYAWKSTNSSAKLAIKLQVTGGNLQGDSNNLTFGSAYFDSVSTASTPDGDVSVSTQIVNTNTFYLIYDHFNGSFMHDPLFGAVASSSNTNSSTSNSDSQNTTSSGFEVFGLLGSFIVLGIVYTKKR